MCITQILSQPEFRAGKNNYSKAGKGFLQGFWFLPCHWKGWWHWWQAGNNLEVIHEDSSCPWCCHRVTATSETLELETAHSKPWSRDLSVRARDWSCSQLLLYSQKQENEHWNMLPENSVLLSIYDRQEALMEELCLTSK